MPAQALDRIGKRPSQSSTAGNLARHTLALLLLALLVVHLSEPAAGQALAGREVTIAGEQSKQQFAAGGSIRIRANVADDVFAAGREITVEGARAHAMFLAGGTIAIRDSTLRDVFAAAHDVAILGTIEDDALIAVCPICPWGSGRLLLGPQARIGDDARLVAGSVEIEGTVGGDLRATARRIVISGTVSGKADLTAKEIVIATGARLAGELVTRSPKPAEIAAGASVAGPVRAIETEVNIPDPRDLPRMLGWIAAAAAVILIVGALVLAALVQLAAPGLLSQGAARMRAELWGCVGRGLAWALILPAIGLLLFVSLIGLPAAVLLMATLLVLWALAFVTSAYAIGLWVRNRRAAAAPEPRAGGRIGWTLLGIIVLLIAWAVPIVGWIFAVLALLGGLGAVAGGLWRRVRHADASAPAGTA
jgi:hypothetical protein